MRDSRRMFSRMSANPFWKSRQRPSKNIPFPPRHQWWFSLAKGQIEGVRVSVRRASVSSRRHGNAPSNPSPPAKRAQRSYSSGSSSSPKASTAPDSIFDQQYNPELPDLDYEPYQSSHKPNPQRTLVTVVTNAEPLATEQKRRYPTEDQRGGARTKRHVITTSYPNNGNRKRPCEFELFSPEEITDGVFRAKDACFRVDLGDQKDPQ